MTVEEAIEARVRAASTLEELAIPLEHLLSGGYAPCGDEIVLPSRTIRPDVGETKPAIMRKVVVLPQPEGPSSERNSPCGRLRDTSRTAWTEP